MLFRSEVDEAPRDHHVHGDRCVEGGLHLRRLEERRDERVDRSLRGPGCCTSAGVGRRMCLPSAERSGEDRRMCARRLAVPVLLLLLGTAPVAGAQACAVGGRGAGLCFGRSAPDSGGSRRRLIACGPCCRAPRASRESDSRCSVKPRCPPCSAASAPSARLPTLQRASQRAVHKLWKPGCNSAHRPHLAREGLSTAFPTSCGP